NTDTWFAVDLGAVYDLSRVYLYWEAAYAKAYQIQVSNDYVQFTTIHDGTASAAGAQDIALAGTGRYLRVFLVTAFNDAWGMSIIELEAYGTLAADQSQSRDAAKITFTPNKSALIVPNSAWAGIGGRTSVYMKIAAGHTLDSILVNGADVTTSYADDFITFDVAGDTNIAVSLRRDFGGLVPAEPAVITLPRDAGRAVVSLDGIWEATNTATLTAPATTAVPEFDNLIPVPGLWDTAAVDMGAYASQSLWHRRAIVMPEGYDPETFAGTVVLEIMRAQFGRFIYVNGRYVDHYDYNYTYSHTDIAPYLHAGENEIVIALTNRDRQRADGANPAHTGRDQERTQYFPGIYDSVNIIATSGTTVSDALQVKADLERSAVTVRATLENKTAAAATTDVTYNVYELGVFADGAAPGRALVGTLTVPGVTVGAGKTTLADASVAVSHFTDAKAWTPNSPFLYEIEVVSSGDKFSKRFGMRTFEFDAVTHLPMLNGKPHYLNGTNVAMHRFFEDPLRGTHPFDETWVRRVYAEFKSVNWDVLRTHVGTLPSIWYELADELGFMIVDEYAWWGCDDGCTLETLMPEIYAWVDEKSSHPSLIIWDAQNESTNESRTTGFANRILNEGYDIQQRPWDNGWTAPVSSNAPIEYHPYVFSRAGWTLESFNVSDPTIPHYGYPNISGNTNANVKTLPNPKMVNEYAYIWTNRIGEPTSLTLSIYNRLLPGATNAERLEYYAMATAQSTEFWRSGRYLIGVQQFCGLSYSKPGQTGQTGDVLDPDLTVPTIRPEVKRWFTSAFAPLALIIQQYGDITVAVGVKKAIPVTLINDLNEDIAGLPVTLSVYAADGALIQSETKRYTVSRAGAPNQADAARGSFDLTLDPNAADFGEGERLRLVASYERGGETVTSERALVVSTAVSIGKPAFASFENTLETTGVDHPAAHANDGSPGTRWSSQNGTTGSAADWITIDLGKTYHITEAELIWEAARATAYEIQISDDNVNFTTIAAQQNVTTTTQRLALTGKGRYIRMQGVSAVNASWGYSLYEFTVWGYEDISIDARVLIKPAFPPVEENHIARFRITARDDITLTAIAAAYDGDGRLIGIDASSASIAAGETVPIEASLAHVEGAAYRFYVWDAGCKPLAEVTAF
ncbi:MAG: discoidin domain-containing protein, partial [Oscillospiraceae bacterium]|nr:discoidin domain-containing protein [Oscillospiraceae bacterium]